MNTAQRSCPGGGWGDLHKTRTRQDEIGALTEEQKMRAAQSRAILWKAGEGDGAGFTGEPACRLGFDCGEEEWDSEVRKPQSKSWGVGKRIAGNSEWLKAGGLGPCTEVTGAVGLNLKGQEPRNSARHLFCPLRP